jgi:hypothetical protein
LVNLLLSSLDRLLALNQAFHSCGAAFKFFALFDKKLLRQVAASSFKQTFFMMLQFSLYLIGIGGLELFDMLLRRCYSQDIIHINCNVEKHIL